MRKSLKVLAAGLAVVPCALALTACGGTNHTLVDTTGSYAETSSYSAMQEYVADSETTTELNSYKMLINLDISMSMMGMTAHSDSKTESIIQISEDGTTLNMSLISTSRVSAPGVNENSTTSVYVKDNYMIMNYGLGYSTPVLLETLDQFTGSSLDLENVFSSFSEEDLAKLNVKVDEDENTTKFKVTLDGSLLESYMENSGAMAEGLDIFGEATFTYNDATMYYVFENGAFAGATMNISFNGSVQSQEGTMSFSCNAGFEFTGYEGNVTFPTDLPSAE